MTQTPNEIAHFFVEASKALEELPHVKGKLNEVEESLAICRDIGNGKDARIESLLVYQGDLDVQIAMLKKERDDAELAAMEAKDQAERLIASIRDVMKGAAAADAILNPTPAPQPSSATSEAGRVGDQPSESSSAQSALDSGSGSDGPSLSGYPSDAATQADSHTVTVGGEQRPLDAPLQTGSLSTAHSEPGIGTDSASQSSSLADGSAVAKPYDGEAYWLKPDSIGWREWVDGGGEAAPYVNLDHHSGR